MKGKSALRAAHNLNEESITPMKKEIARYIESHATNYNATADEIWGYAETAFREHRSMEAQIRLLESEGFTVERGTGNVETAFCGSWGSGQPVIAFLGEFDALAGLSQKAGVDHKEPLVPGGNGHGCGHNLLGVASIAAAAALKHVMAECGLKGTVRYYGCPGEEGGSGKAFMAREGVFDDVDAAITWHPASCNYVCNTSSLANSQIYYRFYGVASHAAAAPHLGRSALDAVELMNVGVQFLREHMIPEARIHYAITDTGGVSPNVVQPYAEVLYLIRAPKSSQVKDLVERVDRIAQGAALMTDTRVEKDFVKSCANVINNETLERAMQANLEAIGAPAWDEEDEQLAEKIFATTPPAGRYEDIRKHLRGTGEAGRRICAQAEKEALARQILPYVPSGEPQGGSTDVGDVSWQTPTVQLEMGTWPNSTPGHSWQIVAVGKSPMAHKATLQAAKVMAATGLDLITTPELLAQARAELTDRLQGETYVPIPAGVRPRGLSGAKN